MRTQRNHHSFIREGLGRLALLCLVVLAWASTASAQLPAPGTPWAFEVDGFIQEAKLDGTVGAGTALQGGHIKVNGHMITVPSNTVVVLPANNLTWQELFAQAPAPYLALGQTGMAANDGSLTVPPPLAQYEAHVIGNVEPAAGCTNLTCSGEYVAGLVYISQQGSNSGTGYINFIDYTNGELLVGGTPGSSTDGTRVRLNDPNGVFGRANLAGSTDPRFSVGSFHTVPAPVTTLDFSNPTIRSVTGFPMCLPRTAPGAGGDALCPESQRPALGPGVGQFTTNDPATGLPPTPFLQAPFEVGDYITFAGTLVQDCAITGCPGGGPTAGPYPVPAVPPAKANTFISAHTIVNNIAIYTFPGTNPAYVAIDVALMGTGGTTVLGLNEAAIRTRFEGFTTDISRNIHLYGVDLACDGTESSLRDWGTIGVDQGPPTGAAKGRWRFRPPCTGVASTTTTLGTVTDKVCSPPAAGVFDPPPRDVRAVLELPANGAGVAAIPAWIPGQTTTAANGIIYGQYHTPITDYIFPEQVVGSPVPPDNFETMAFLFNGGVMSTAGTLSTGLNPWPLGLVAPPVSSCAGIAPTITASASPTPVTAGQVVNLTAVTTGTPVPTVTWAQTAGTAGTFSGTTGNAVSWTAPSVAASETATFTATATNASGTATSSASVTVNPPAAPTVTPSISSTQVASNGTVTLSATATGVAPITFQWTQTSGPAGVFAPLAANTASVTWTAPPVGVLTTATFQVTATAANGTASAPIGVSINPVGAPTIQPIAAQTVTVGSAVSIPVTVTSTNTQAKLTLAVSPNNLLNFKINGPSNVCTATGCTDVFTVTFTAPSVAQVITFTITATDAAPVNLTSAPATATVTVQALQNPVIAHVTPITVTSGTTVNLPVVVTSANLGAAITLAAVQTTAFPIVPNPPTVSKTGQSCTATLCTFNFTVSFTLTLPTNPLQTTNDVVALTLTATDTSVTPNLVSAPEFTTVTVTPIPDQITITSVEDRTGKQRVIVNATDNIISPNVVLTVQPYVCNGGATACPASATQPIAGQYDPCKGVGCTMTNNGGGLYIITMVGAPAPECRSVGGTFATPCTVPVITVKSNINGTSPPSVVTRIRN